MSEPGARALRPLVEAARQFDHAPGEDTAAALEGAAYRIAADRLLGDFEAGTHSAGRLLRQLADEVECSCHPKRPR